MQNEQNQMVMICLEDLVPEEHFLRKLAHAFPWEKWALPFEKCFKGEKEYGPHGYPVSVLLKITVLSYMYEMGDKETEEFVRYNNAARYFTGLGIHQKVPDETTICRFRGRIAEKRELWRLEELFNKFLFHAQDKGVEIGKVQIIDSVHTLSKISINKSSKKGQNDKQGKQDEKSGELEDKGEAVTEALPCDNEAGNESKKENDNNNNGKTAQVEEACESEAKAGNKTINAKDPDACWGCKGKGKRKNPETGKMEEYKKFFFGYKTHVTCE